MNYLLFVAVYFALLFDKLNICLYFFISVLLHESAHIIMCYVLGCNPKITVSVFGIKLRKYPIEKNKKLLVLLAGPLVNLVTVIICQIILSIKFTMDFYILWMVNIIIFVINILPMHYLDGGQILAAYFGNKKIRNIADIISVVFVVIIAISFSQQNFNTAVAVSLFLVYYLINKNNLHI